ncbi:MAG: S66 peptidase family protein [Candidatus Polarisedimenticolia bacterium]
MRRPPAPLRPGDRIGVAAPGGPVRTERLEAGLAYLERRGYRPVEGRHLRERHGYLAGPDRDRRADLQGMISDPSIAAIWFARGGYGTGRILEAIDLSPLRRRPKTIVGYSDSTMLQAAADRTIGLPSFYGPIVAELGEPDSFDEESLWSALVEPDRALTFALPRDGVVRAGRGEGRVVGGCLSLLAALAGSRWLPRTRGAILFWEEVNEQPFRIDRMLMTLRHAGALEGIAGMVVGSLTGCEPKDPDAALTIREILETHLRGARVPVLTGLQAGHCRGKVTLPLGRRAVLTSRPPRLLITGR